MFNMGSGGLWCGVEKVEKIQEKSYINFKCLNVLIYESF